MEFLKRNIGLLLFSVVALGLAGFLTVKIFGQLKVLHAQYAKVKEQQDQIESISKLEIALTPDNLENAKKNVDLAQKAYSNARIALWKKYSIPEENASPVECMRILQKKCLEIGKFLDDKEVMVPQNLRYFSFERKVSRLPRADEVKVILKQLKIIREIARLLGDSYIVQLKDLQRLTDTNVIQKDWYALMPFKIVIVGELPRIQEFVNRLQEKSKYYFAVRYFSLEGTIRGGNGLPNLPAAAAGGGGASGGPGAMGPGGAAGMMPGGAGPEAAGGAGMMGPGGGAEGAAGMMGPGGAGGPAGMMAPAGANPGMMGPEAAGAAGGEMMRPGALAGAMAGMMGRQARVVKKETREDRIIFKKPQLITASIRFDFVEFLKPEEND